jgi:transcriptional regulator EpsA
MGVFEAPWPAQAPPKPAAEVPLKSFEFTADESVRFLRIVAECSGIRRHYDIYRWLRGEVQHFLPHDILLSAWGDFATWDLKLDLTSALPGVRTASLAHCRVDSLLRHAYARWIDAGRSPVLLKPADIEPPQYCHCPIHSALRRMRSVVVHGVHDKRSGSDSLFIAFGAGAFAKGRSTQRVLASLDALFAQIDAAFRKVPAFPLAAACTGTREGANVLDLSVRELEVLESICKGKTNLDIAAALDISPFTVKNHVQRIFRKIGVTNRTQAAARYTEAVRQAALALSRQESEAPALQASAA